MLKDITLGQYFPGDSVFHRADPRAKIILGIVFIVAVFLADSPLSYAFLLLSTVLMIAVSRIPFKTVLRSMRALIFIIIFTSVINIFWTRGEHLIFEWKFIHIYREGLTFAAYMVIRITCLLCGTGVMLSYTTSPIALTDGLEQLLSPLKKIKLPVHEFSMMMTIALRFIPTLIEETDKIMSAQRSRGADLSSGGLIRRAKALIPVLIPLFVSAFRRADDLAVAMECRCYHGGEGRTRMNKLHFGLADLALTLAFAAFTAGIVLLNKVPLNVFN
ncbi:MAG: energy-coupling factor transporter transmembrane protein EcfT [Clostridia bacterium]|nr:energy-coupling factor transporter transmembrane protein EcfT [Clostridia bacterium]